MENVSGAMGKIAGAASPLCRARIESASAAPFSSSARSRMKVHFDAV